MPDAPEAVPAEVDVVFTWVDGNDPAHIDKRSRHCPATGYVDDVAGTTRFASLGEIDRAVNSVLRFAPFVRRIHVVTDQQTPHIVQQARHWPAALRDKVAVVDHRDVFAGLEANLPTFSSLAIESVLHRVPGLAEHHVYLNDDFMLIKPVERSDWFEHGLPVLRGRWRTPMDREVGQRLKSWLRAHLGRPKEKRPLYQRSQALAASLAGYTTRYFSTHHVPHPMRRSTLEAYFRQHPQALTANLQSRFRDISQFNTPALANHLELRARTAHTTAEARHFYAEPAAMTLRQLETQLRAVERDPQVLCACLQSLDGSAPEAQALVLAWLDRVVGCAADEAARSPAAQAKGVKERAATG